MRRELTAANIVLLVQGGVANDLPSLCRAFGIETAYSYYVQQHIRSLQEAGILVDDGSGLYKVSENWRKNQVALGISLRQIAKIGPRTMLVEPYFGLPDTFANPIDLFVVMPFQSGLKPIWEDHIKIVAQNLGLTATRADDFFAAHSIMSDVWTAICQAQAIIADCTGRNPNVFYEIGIAHTIGKPVILITQNNDDVPFDVRHLRYIQYEYTPRGMQQFEQRLTETLKTELGLSRET